MIEQNLKNIVGGSNFLTGKDVLDRYEYRGRESLCPAKVLDPKGILNTGKNTGKILKKGN